MDPINRTGPGTRRGAQAPRRTDNCAEGYLAMSYPIGYNPPIVTYIVQQTEVFARWLSSVKDQRARIAIARRIERASAGNLGDAKPIREGVSEMRVDVGVGYRVYFTMRRGIVVVLLAGGEKGSQQRDIKRAIDLAKEV